MKTEEIKKKINILLISENEEEYEKKEQKKEPLEHLPW